MRSRCGCLVLTRGVLSCPSVLGARRRFRDIDIPDKVPTAVREPVTGVAAGSTGAGYPDFLAMVAACSRLDTPSLRRMLDT